MMADSVHRSLRDIANVVAGHVTGHVVQAGVVEGGIHQYYGTRHHVIEPFSAVTPAEPDWLMAQPSRLLDARSQVVPFVGRETELQRLRGWRDSGKDRLSVLLLHAPGGQGKTRLASEFAQRSRSPELPAADRWQVLQAGFDLTSTGSIPADEPGDGAGVLLIVDYADRWAHSELERLFADPVLHRSRRTRVLLIARTVRWYAALRSDLNDLRASAHDLLLPPLTTDRHTMFATARDRFAAPDLYDLAGDLAPPGTLDHPDFGLILTVHMAALVAVDAHRRGAEPPAEPHELSAYLLDREYRTWQRLFETGPRGQDFTTRPAIMARTVFVATLTGAVDHETGIRVVQQAELPGQPDELLLDHRFCYPPTDRRLVLEPLYPDRLAEDFLALLTPGHDITAYDPDPWTTKVPGKLLLDFNELLATAIRGMTAQPAPASGTTAEDLPVYDTALRQAVAARALTFLASATDRWPHVGTEVLYPLLRAQPSVAITAGSAALSAIANIGEVPLEVLGAVEQVLPRRRNVSLDIGAAAIASTLGTRILPLVHDPADQAAIHLEINERLAHAGRLAEALEHSHRAADIRERLAATDRATHLPGLASTIGTYSIDLADNGRHAEAVVQSERAVALHEELAAIDRAEWLPELARTMNNHGLRLKEMGRRTEALECSRRAVELHEELYAVDHAKYRPLLASALANHAILTGQAGFLGEAVVWSQRAVTLREELAADNRAEHLPDLATSINNHAVRLAEVGRRADALVYCERAVVLREELVETNRAAYLPYLGTSVLNLALRLSDAERYVEALDCSERGIRIYEELVAANRSVHLTNLSKAITNHVTVLAGTGRHTDALAYSERAIALHEELCAGNRAAHLPELAATLYNHAARLAGVDKHVEALAFTERAIRLHEELVAGSLEPGNRRKLAATLYKHALLLNALARRPEATPLLQRAIALRDALGDVEDVVHLPELTEWMHTYSAWLAESGHSTEAFEVSQRVIALQSGLTNIDEAVLADSLSSHAVLLAERGQHAEAFASSERAVQRFEKLVAADPTTPLPGQARAFTNHSNRLATAGRHTEALACAERALELFSQLAKTDRRNYLPALALAAHNHVVRLVEVGRYVDAHTPSRQSVEVSRELVDTLGDEHLPALARGLQTFAAVRVASGVELPEAALASREALHLHQQLSSADLVRHDYVLHTAEVVEAVASKLHWQLYLGYELEHIYCAYSESTRSHDVNPEWAMDRCYRVVERLRELNIAPALTESFSQAVNGLLAERELTKQEEAVMWLVRRSHTRRRIEYLIGATHDAVRRRGLRYYSCGVMLCRVRVFAEIVNADAPTEPRAARTHIGMLREHHAELLRTSTALESFIRHTDEGSPRDPQQHDLDLHLDRLADYLVKWRAAGAVPDDRFAGELDDVMNAAGLRMRERVA